MPEMPEVEAVCRRLRADAVGARIQSASVNRCARPELADAAAGRVILAVDRKAKHILIRLAGGVTLHAHLRMSGNLRVIPDSRLAPASARVLLRLKGGKGLILEDPRALARMEAVSSTEIDNRLASLGPEPLSPGFTTERFVELARSSRQPAKTFLMDQNRVSGLGNIYAAEALFRARIGPRRTVSELSRPRLARLHAAIVAIIADAVESAYLAYAGPGEFREAETFPVSVYGREGEPCTSCGGLIRRITQGGRSTYYCPRCQR
jgi:formamidopyrimidine-DNA glycosylase